MGEASLNCSSKLAKYILFLFNLIFWVVGAVVLGTGIWVLADPHATQILHIATLDANQGLIHAAAITLIVVGAIIFLAGFLGCCGAIKESACMLLMYACIVGFVLLLQVVAGIMAAVCRDQIKAQLETSLNTTVQSRYGGDTESTEGMDIMQRMFECCGASDGPVEWKTSNWRKTSNHTVPDSCCVLQNQFKFNEKPIPVDATMCYKLGGEVPTNGTNEYIFTKGCQPKMNDWIHDNAGIVIGISLGLAAVQLVGVILACCLRNRIKNSYEYV